MFLHKALHGGCCLALVSSLIAAPVFAKPISYVGGTMIMQENDETGYTLAVDYTLTPKIAVGFYGKTEISGDKFTVAGPQVNTLVKRWNLPEGQGNIFTMTGAGLAQRNGAGPNDTQFAAWTGVLADYETRRIFTSYELRLMYAQHIEKSAWQRARIGFAPYLANYDDLNTWIMLQVDHHPAKSRAISATPMVRFFYKSFLAEGGVNTRGEVLFNWVQQF